MLLPAIFICLLLSLSACKITSDKKISDKVLNDRKAEFEKYLAETYPDETFTVEVWQEYGKETGAAGLPDYEGYMMRQIVTDSKGNRFRVYIRSKGKYSDDYKDVLEGRVHYNEKGQQVYEDE